VRDGFKQSALVAWQSYQETGQHITEDESDGWLACLESGQDVEPPESHLQGCSPGIC
jgi:hypothetical protein